MNEEIEALVEYRLDQADESLKSARLLLEQGICRGAANRAYYAMFYAILALLAPSKRETSKHSGAISIFDRDFVRPGIFGPELSAWLHETFHLRQEADYRPMAEISPDRAGAALERAGAFVAAVKAEMQKTAAEPGAGPEDGADDPR